MKHITLIIALIFTLTSCKNDTSEAVSLEENRAKSYDANDGLITIKGDFLYDPINNAAILQKNENTIYAVVVDDNMHLLNEKAKPFKTDKFSYVPVTVRVNKLKNDNPNSIWEYKLEIKAILNIEQSKPEDKETIKLENKDVTDK